MADRDYWTRKLKGEPWVSPTPTWPARSGDGVQHLNVSIPEEISEKVKKLVGNSDFLTLTILLSSLGLCLSRYFDHRVISVGTPSLQGMRTNLLPILVTIDPEMKVKELVMEARSSLLAAYERQNYPFLYLLRDLECSEPAKSPLNVVLEFQGFHAPSPEFACAVKIMMRREKDGLYLAVGYDSAVISAEGVRFFVECWTATLRGMLNDPASALADIDLGVTRKSIAPWSGPLPDYETFMPVHAAVQKT